MGANSGAIIALIVLLIFVFTVAIVMLIVIISSTGGEEEEDEPILTTPRNPQPTFFRLVPITILPLNERIGEGARPPYRTSHWASNSFYDPTYTATTSQDTPSETGVNEPSSVQSGSGDPPSMSTVSPPTSKAQTLPFWKVVKTVDSMPDIPPSPPIPDFNPEILAQAVLNEQPLLKPGSGIIAPYPYYARVLENGFFFGMINGEGVSAVSNPPDSPKGADREVVYRPLPFTPQFRATAVETLSPPVFTGVDDLTAQISYSNPLDGSRRLVVHLSKGFPFITLIYEGLTPVIETVSYDTVPSGEWGPSPLDRSLWFNGVRDRYLFNVKSFEEERPETFLLISGSVKEFTLKENGITGSSAGTYRLKVGHVQNSEMLNLFTRTGPMIFPIQGDVVVTHTEEGASIVYDWSLATLDMTPVNEEDFLLVATPALKGNFQNGLRYEHPVYSPASLVDGGNWSFSIPEDAMVPLEEFPQVPEIYRSQLLPVWKRDASYLTSLSLDGNYIIDYARTLSSEATLLMIGERLGQKSTELWVGLHNKLINDVVSQANRYSSDRPSQGYDPVWGGVISTVEGVVSRGTDLVGPYSSHHRLYGHFLYAAATAAHFPVRGVNEGWFPHFTGYFESLLGDIGTDNHSSIYYPPWRYTDWIYGHSFDNGLISYQELGKFHWHPSEAVHCWYGAWLMGKALDSQRVTRVASALFCLETQGTHVYHMKSGTSFPLNKDMRDVPAVTQIGDVGYQYTINSPSTCPSGVSLVPFPQRHLELIDSVFYPLTLCHFTPGKRTSIEQTTPIEWLRDVREPISRGLDQFNSFSPCKVAPDLAATNVPLLQDGTEETQQRLFNQVLSMDPFESPIRPQAISLWFITISGNVI